MTLLTSISGIRGTIGGEAGTHLTPLDIVKFASAYCAELQEQHSTRAVTVVIGRDARVSGPMVHALVSHSLIGMGARVIDLGLSTTPTVEMAVVAERAAGGIIVTASHNPAEWNALKLLNHRGEFISAELGQAMLRRAATGTYTYAGIESLGSLVARDTYMDYHIAQIVAHPLVQVEAIGRANFKIAVDAVNSSGGIFVPALLSALGVKHISCVYCEPSGLFPHNPEPLPEHLQELSSTVVTGGCDLGIAVDPDVDRLALVCEDGSMFGEEYTLVAVADYVLTHRKGAAVSNLSSSRALSDVARKHGVPYKASAVGEVHVVEAMKETQAVIGGEGNGGIILPDLHYGRDALIGIALFLTHLATERCGMRELRQRYPGYEMSKNKLPLSPDVDVDEVLEQVARHYAGEQVNRTDGVKIDFAEGWVHLRKSNTEPIIRVYSEAATAQQARQLADGVMDAVKAVFL